MLTRAVINEAHNPIGVCGNKAGGRGGSCGIQRNGCRIVLSEERSTWMSNWNRCLTLRVDQSNSISLLQLVFLPSTLAVEPPRPASHVLDDNRAPWLSWHSRTRAGKHRLWNLTWPGPIFAHYPPASAGDCPGAILRTGAVNHRRKCGRLVTWAFILTQERSNTTRIAGRFWGKSDSPVEWRRPLILRRQFW